MRIRLQQMSSKSKPDSGSYSEHHAIVDVASPPRASKMKSFPPIPLQRLWKKDEKYHFVMRNAIQYQKKKTTELCSFSDWDKNENKLSILQRDLVIYTSSKLQGKKLPIY